MAKKVVERAPAARRTRQTEVTTKSRSAPRTAEKPGSRTVQKGQRAAPRSSAKKEGPRRSGKPVAATTVRTAAQGKLRGSPERARVVQRAQSAVSRPATSSSERTKLATRRSAAAASDTRKLAATEHPPPTQWTPSESEALAVLALEDAADDPREANRKLERRLRDKGLKPLGREHVERLRAFKNAVQADLGSGPKSRHFTEPHGLYANPEDFDYSKLVRDYTAAFPSISAAAVAAFIPVGVYYYYLR